MNNNNMIKDLELLLSDLEKTKDLEKKNPGKTYITTELMILRIKDILGKGE